MRFGLSSSIGMDQADAIQMYTTGNESFMKEEQSHMALYAMEEHPFKFPAAKHNENKSQFHQVAVHILEACESFVREAKILLTEHNHCIPSLTEIKVSGRRIKDK